MADSPMPNVQTKLGHAAQWMAVAAAAAILAPPFWLSLSTALMLLFWLLSGNWALRWQRIRAQPLAMMALALLAWSALGMTWSPASWREAFRSWWEYRELLWLVLLLSLLDQPQWGWRMLYAFLLAFFVNLLLSYGQWLGWLPGNRWGLPSAYVSHIPFSTALAFVCWTCFWLAKAQPQRRGLWMAYGLLGLTNLFLVSGGRTGQVIFVALLFLCLLQRWRWRGLVAATALTSAAFFSLYQLSPTFHDRIHQGVVDLEQHSAGNTGSFSLALRLEFWDTSLKLVAKHPLLGGGMGSFSTEYGQYADAHGWTGERRATNPHNEYLLVWAQMGMAGVLLLIGIGWVQWRDSGTLYPPASHLARYLLVVMAVGCLFNSFLRDNQEGHLFALLTAALWTLGRQPTTSSA